MALQVHYRKWATILLCVVPIAGKIAMNSKYKAITVREALHRGLIS
jgi:hypothetical protein